MLHTNRQCEQYNVINDCDLYQLIYVFPFGRNKANFYLPALPKGLLYVGKIIPCIYLISGVTDIRANRIL